MTDPPIATAVAIAVRLVGAGLVAATAWIHYDLYQLGFSSVPTIGTLFLVNAIAGMVLAVALLITPRRYLAGAALLAGGFELITLAALVVSLTVGLFGFHETMDAPLIRPTIAVESAGSIILLAFAIADGLPRLMDWSRRRRQASFADNHP